MRFSHSSISTLLAMVTLVPRIHAQGGFNVINLCDATVYWKLTNQEGDYASGVMDGLNYLSNYEQSWGAANDGISVKLDLDGSFANPLQFEVVQAHDGTVWYDLARRTVILSTMSTGLSNRPTYFQVRLAPRLDASSSIVLLATRAARIPLATLTTCLSTPALQLLGTALRYIWHWFFARVLNKQSRLR